MCLQNPNQMCKSIYKTMGLISSSSQHFANSYPVAQPFYDEPIEARLEDSAHRRRRRVTLQLRKSHNPYLIGRANRSIPCTCSITGEGGQRTNVDLVCLIDISGSMMGAKLDLLKETLHYILNLLNENDRLSLIAFNTQAYKLSHLVRVSARNKPALARIINQIRPQGETLIDQGLECALRTLAERKHRNNVSSIFLLSDGKDKTMANCIKLLKDGHYSVHTFGFGTDFDQQFLTEVARVKGGNFYPIIQLDTIDEAFVNALGALFSVVAETVKIRIKQVASGRFSSVRIQKTFGPMWRKGFFSRDYEINVSQLISNSTKDFVFMLEVPLSYEQLTNAEREQHILQAEIDVLTPSGEILRGQTRMSMTFYGASQNPGVEVVPDTYVNAHHLRALSAELIANQRNRSFFSFGGGSAAISSIRHQVEMLAPVEPAIIQPVMESLNKARQQIQVGRCPVYQAVEEPLMLQNNIAYSNPQQIQLKRNLMIHKQRKNTPVLK